MPPLSSATDPASARSAFNRRPMHDEIGSRVYLQFLRIVVARPACRMTAMSGTFARRALRSAHL
jgi:hypothetical protein